MSIHRPRFFVLTLLLATCGLTALHLPYAPPAHAARTAEDEEKKRQKKADIAKSKKNSKKQQNRGMVQRQSPDELKLVAVGRLGSIDQQGQITFENGTKIKLDNIRIPLPAADAAIAVIRETLTGVETGVYVAPDAQPKDYTNETGHTLAHLMTEKGIWLQSELVRRGLAWVDYSPSKSNLVQSLLVYEAQAQKAQLGFWKMLEFSVKTETDIGKNMASFQIYQGKITDISRNGTYLFVRFTAQPQDLTLIVHESLSQSMNDYHFFDIINMKGLVVRVRGWVEDRDGPVIFVTNPAQIQILSGEPLTQQREEKEEEKKKD